MAHDMVVGGDGKTGLLRDGAGNRDWRNRNSSHENTKKQPKHKATNLWITAILS